MSYATVLAGLHAAFGTVDGITVTLAYEPRAIQVTPTLYSLLDSFEVINDNVFGATPDYRYRVLHRLVFAWQDNEQAEAALIPFVNAIPEAVFGYEALRTTITNGGYSYIVAGDAGWVDIGNVTYRSLDFYSETLEHAA